MIPIDEICDRMKCKPRVRERLRKLNPEGVEEGGYPRGWRPRRTLKAIRFQRVVFPVRIYREKWGVAPRKDQLVKLGGKRRAVPGPAFFKGPINPETRNALSRAGLMPCGKSQYGILRKFWGT